MTAVSQLLLRLHKADRQGKCSALNYMWFFFQFDKLVKELQFIGCKHIILLLVLSTTAGILF